jgi:endonuclease/exonuclease/phosphatase family metal-dependent hydrolase
MAGKMEIADEIGAWMDERAIDILFLQEVGQEHGDGAAFMATLRERVRLPYAYAPATPFETGHMQGLAIVSRYPLNDVSVQQLEYNHLRFRSRCRIALAATISTPEGPIRVANVHLDTRISSSRRVEQLTPAIEALDAFEGPQIIGGDFNTMDVGWKDSMWPVPFQHQGDVVREELSKSGFETPFGDTRPTFKLMGLPIKLDWLFFKKLETRESGVDDVPLSDHRGIWTRTSLTPWSNGESDRLAR